MVERVTAGLYYDVADGGGPVRDAIGRGFEAYCELLVSKQMPDMAWVREWSYRHAKRSLQTPDLIELFDDKISLVIECKAAKMALNAKFGEDPSEARGYGELAKGLCQIWRFIGHARAGSVGHKLAADPLALLVTLDDWFMARPQMAEEVFTRANAAADIEGIAELDRVPVALASIADLEAVCQYADRDRLRDTIATYAKPEKRGWTFTVVKADGETALPLKPFPFEDNIAELLPWWGEVQHKAAAAGEHS